jgi:hypothetical protein
MDGNGSGLCLVAGFGFSDIEPLGSATTLLMLIQAGSRKLRLCKGSQSVYVYFIFVFGFGKGRLSCVINEHCNFLVQKFPHYNFPSQLKSML